MNLSLLRLTAINSVFSSRNFIIYTSGNSVSLIGLWVQRLAVGWLTWELTESSFWLGVVASADLFPVFIIGAFGGVIADRYDQRLVSLTCQILSMIQAIIIFLLITFNIINIWLLFCLTLFNGIVVAIHQPVRLSLIHSLVKSKDLTTAVAINSVTFNLARFIGPAIAGVIITGTGVGMAFAVNGVSYIFMITALLWIQLPPKEKAPKIGMFVEALDGVRYVVSHPAIAQIFVLMLAHSVLTRPVFELFPGFAENIFSKGAAGLSILTSALGFGALIGSIWIAQRGGLKGITNITIVCAIISGLMVIFFTSTHIFVFAVGTMFVMGITMVIFGILIQTLLQHVIADHMRGRVLALWGIIFRGGPAVGAIIIGWLSDLFGLNWPLRLGSILCVIIALLMQRRWSQLILVSEK